MIGRALRISSIIACTKALYFSGSIASLIIFSYVALMQIDHDQNEPKIDRRPESFRLFFVILALIWAGYLYSFPIDWRSVGLGAISGGGLLLWASVRFKDLW